MKVVGRVEEVGPNFRFDSNVRMKRKDDPKVLRSLDEIELVTT